MDEIKQLDAIINKLKLESDDLKRRKLWMEAEEHGFIKFNVSFCQMMFVRVI